MKQVLSSSVFRLHALLFCLIILVHVAQSKLAPLAGIEIGAEFSKVVLIQPGRQPDILLNEQSARKTPTAVSFAQSERAFGNEAIGHLSRSPRFVFGNFYDFLGRSTLDSKIIKSEFYPNIISESTDRKTFVFDIAKTEEGGEKLTAEELVAHYLSYFTDLIKKSDSSESLLVDGGKAGGFGIEAVFVVPTWLDYRQRQAIVQAASIAKIHVLGLVHAPVAASIQHALDLPGNQEPTYKIFLNVGGGSSEGCLIKYEYTKPVKCAHLESACKPEMHISAIACSPAKLPALTTTDTLDITRFKGGANAIDMIATKRLLQEAGPSSTPTKSALLHRAYNEIHKAKHALSVNKEFQTVVERLTETRDLKKTLDRNFIDESVKESGLLENISKIADDLREAFKSEPEGSKLEEVELIGGGWRVPMVQNHLTELFAPTPLQQKCNPDEAMVHGAALMAANLSSVFRLRPLYVHDPFPETLQLSILGLGKNLRTVLNEKIIVNEESNHGWTRQFVFNHSDDFNVAVWEVISENEKRLLDLWNVTGVKFAKSGVINNKTTAAASHGDGDMEQGSVKVQIRYTASGLIQVDKAHVSFPKNEEATAEVVASPENVTTETNTAVGNDSTSSGKEALDNSTKTEKVILPNRVFHQLRIRKIDLSPLTDEIERDGHKIRYPLPLSEKSMTRLSKDLETRIERDASSRNLAESINSLESEIYQLADLLDRQNSNLTNKEKTTLKSTLTQIEEWMQNEDRQNLNLAVIQDKQTLISTAFKPLKDRLETQRQKDERERQVRSLISSARRDMDRMVNETERQVVANGLGQFEEWWNNRSKVADVKKLETANVSLETADVSLETADVSLETADVSHKSEIESEFQKLVGNLIKPKKRKARRRKEEL